MSSKRQPPSQTLGTLLRHLAEILDTAVEQTYIDSGLDYRPRFTPVFRTLLDLGPSPIRELAVQAGITHSAASQTVAEMAKRGWVQMSKGSDGRQQIVALTRQSEEATPLLRRHWAATNTAADSFDRELSSSLANLLQEAIDALVKTSFAERIAQADADLKVAV